MSLFFGNTAQIVSPSVYGLILSSPHLREALIPGGLVISPYEILDYDATLVLHDARGAKATFRRRQTVRFLQNGVSAILDHAWGKGVLVTNYWTTAGLLEDSFKEEGTRHLVIGLKRGMASGEILRFEVERTAMEGFVERKGRLETTLDHPIKNLRRNVVFPKSRPVQVATFDDGDGEIALRSVTLPDGRTAVRIDIPNPKAGIPYTIRWCW